MVVGSRNKELDTFNPMFQGNLYRVNPVSDGDNNISATAIIIKSNLWFDLQTMTGNRAFEYGQIVNGKPSDVVMYYYPELTIDENCYILLDSRKLFFHSVVNDRNTFLKILAYEKQ
jgi:hypothetical protein